MATISTQAPDGANLNIDIPEGTDPSKYDAMVDDVQAHYASTKQGPMESAARGALRNFPLAQQAVAAVAPYNPFSEKPTYSAEIKYLPEAAEQGKAQNPKSYYAGAAAGTFAPLAIPLVGEGLEAAPILGNAALNAGQSLSDVDLTNPTKQDLGNAAVAGVLGGGLGAVGKGIRALAPSAEELAASSTAKGLGATARNIGKVMGDNPEKQIGELGSWLNSKPGIVGLANRPGKMLNAVQAVHDEAGKTIGGIIDEVAPHATVNGAKLISELTPIADELNIIEPLAQTKVLNVIKKITDLDEAGKLDFAELQKLKGVVGKASHSDPHMEQAYGHFAQYMNDIVDAYGAKIGDAEQLAKYNAAKLDYRNASQVLPIMRRATGRELSQGPMGNSGLLGLFGLGAGVAAGHPIGGAAAALGSAVGRPIANMVGRNAALKAVPYMPAVAATGRGLTKAAQIELANALESKYREK